MIRILVIALLICAVVFFSFSIEEADEKINGVSLVSPPREITSDAFVTLERVGTDWVGVIPYAFSYKNKPQVTYDHDRQWWGERTEGTVKLIQYAREHGHKVMLKPHVWIMGSWVGEYDLETEADWRIWEEDYRSYLLNYAKVAQEQSVELLCVGTEYKYASVKRKAYWIGLIDEVRSIYKGKLTYAANWDNYEQIEFWDRLDYIGIDAYFPLVQQRHPTIESMEASWENIRQKLNRFSTQNERPILFTEYGYQSVNGAAGNHWEVQTNEENLNMRLQAEAYECLYRTFWDESWFAGGFLWKWHFNDLAGGPNNPHWTPQGKPAEKVIKKWYD